MTLQIKSKMKPKQKPKLLLSVNHALTFGKYKGHTILKVMHKDANCIHWCLQNISGFKLSRIALLLLPPETDLLKF